jgi:hypothetical protein
MVYLEWNAIWDMSIVISVLDGIQTLDKKFDFDTFR